jgi:hypothetical protein
MRPCLLSGDEMMGNLPINTPRDKDAEGNVVNRLAQDGEVSAMRFLTGTGWPVYRMQA